MELRHMRSFVVLAGELHFARAAELLGMSGSTLTIQIQELERALQARLFSRTKRSVALTAAGEVFLAQAQRALAQFDQAVDAGRRAGRGQVGRIELGYVGSASFAGILQDQVRRFRKAWPGVALNTQERPMDQLPGLIEAGQLDVAFVRMPMALPPELASHVLVRDRFCLALPADHPLAGPAAQGRPAGIRPREVARETFIVPEQDFGLREVARRGRFTPRIGAAPGGLLTVLTHISLGAGVGVVPGVLRRVVALPHIVFKDIAGPAVHSEVAAVYRRHEKSPAVRNFVAQLAGTAPVLV